MIFMSAQGREQSENGIIWGNVPTLKSLPCVSSLSYSVLSTSKHIWEPFFSHVTDTIKTKICIVALRILIGTYQVVTASRQLCSGSPPYWNSANLQQQVIYKLSWSLGKTDYLDYWVDSALEKSPPPPNPIPPQKYEVPTFQPCDLTASVSVCSFIQLAIFQDIYLLS